MRPSGSRSRHAAEDLQDFREDPRTRGPLVPLQSAISTLLIELRKQKLTP